MISTSIKFFITPRKALGQSMVDMPTEMKLGQNAENTSNTTLKKQLTLNLKNHVLLLLIQNLMVISLPELTNLHVMIQKKMTQMASAVS